MIENFDIEQLKQEHGAKLSKMSYLKAKLPDWENTIKEFQKLVKDGKAELKTLEKEVLELGKRLKEA